MTRYTTRPPSPSEMGAIRGMMRALRASDVPEDAWPALIGTLALALVHRESRVLR